MGASVRGRKVRSEVCRADSAGNAAGEDSGAAGNDSPLIEWVVDRTGLRLGLGDSVNYTGQADLVFTHPYGPLPPQLVGRPMIINLYGDKRAAAERWCGAQLHEISKWGRGLTNTVYSANGVMHVARRDLTDLVEDDIGWFPEELVRRLLTRNVAGSSRTVFDGFMGRGTVGKIAREYGWDFVGIDKSAERVALTREYLNV